MHSALLSVSAVLRNLTPIRALPSPVGLVQSPCTTDPSLLWFTLGLETNSRLCRQVLTPISSTADVERVQGVETVGLEHQTDVSGLAHRVRDGLREVHSHKFRVADRHAADNAPLPEHRACGVGVDVDALGATLVAERDSQRE